MGSPSLNVCGHEFASEADRVARYQVVEKPREKIAYLLSNEVIANDSEESAARALDEWRSAIDDCPIGEYVDSSVADTPDSRYSSAKQAPDDSLPVSDNSVTTTVDTQRGDPAVATSRTILQRHGTVLAVIYLATLDRMSTAQVAEATRLANVVGRRMLKPSA